MAGMNIQQRTAKTLSPPGLSTAPDVARAPRDEWLRAHEDSLAVTYEHVGVGIAEIDRAGRMLRVNQKVCELTGREAADLVGRSIFDETSPQDLAQDLAQFRRQIAGELDRYTIEKRLARADGSYFWAEVTSSGVRDASGNFLYAVRVQHDISARKETEQALARRSEEQAALFRFSEGLQYATSLSDVYEAGLDAILAALACERASILLFDDSDVMRFVGWRGLSDGYRKAVEGHSPWDRNERNPRPVYFEDVGQSDLSDALKETVARERIAAVAFIPIMIGGRLAGKFMAYYEKPHRFAEPEIAVALTLARQLGFGVARLRAEQARSLAEERAQQLVFVVESSDDAIISKDLDGIIRTWNSGAERLFGHTASEAIGQPVTILFPPGLEDEEPGILARIRRGERIHHYETVRRRKDGSLLDISLTVSPVRDGEGRIVGASKIARDITDRKEAERKLRESEQRLTELLAAIPAAIYTTDAQGKITYFNEAAVEFSGRTPVLGSDEWCVTWKLFMPDGGGAEGRARCAWRRSGRGAAGRDAGSLHSVPDAAAGFFRQGQRRHQHAGGYQRAAAGGKSAAAAARRTQPSHQEQHADAAVAAVLRGQNRAQRGGAESPERSQRADLGHGGGATRAVRPQ
jgi:PAS domain S-box-containing protein